MPWSKKGSGYTKADAPKGKGGFIKNPDQYEALKGKGFDKSSAAAITNSDNKKRKSK